MINGIELQQVYGAVRDSRGYPEAGLSVQRRIDNHGDPDWVVEFGLNSFMTHITTEDIYHWSDQQITDFIADNWDSDWDDVQVESPVGDFSIGSRDFTQSNKDTTQ